MSFVVIARSTQSDPNEFDRKFALLQKEVRKPPYDQPLADPKRWYGFLRADFLEKEFFLFEKSGRPVARVGVNLSSTQKSRGFLGFYEVDVSDPEAKKISHEIMNAAFTWLKTRGVTEIYGPVDFNTWFTYRFSEPPKNIPYFIWEPFNPPEYIDFFLAEGFEQSDVYKTRSVCAQNRLRTGIACLASIKSYLKAVAMGFRFRQIDKENLLRREIPIMYELSMAAFKDNHLFEPIPIEVFRELYAQAAAHYDFRFSKFALDRNGKEVGFMFSFIDRDCAILKSVAVLPEYRNARLGTAMSYLHVLQMFKYGPFTGISALVRTGLASEKMTNRFGRIGVGNWVRNYYLYKKILTN